ncbi:2-(5'-triphosphoribosyl)-3'-dephospho CoA synthase [Paenibacillus sp. IHB B 3084]|uniref:triphosphoribosyl-dephospho-CoA synthase CitG n=1 Tax=Paenibacillus sp. IHB B 3084 TaxID=867076 RepID=UPI0007207556|nr:triphosphoribosyl-dephospho-CoA synthase CitG [Paenibacillus sp. IHB B 3084]ALP37930.1 2-(5'-triphosphoribosyl)-3'-dephospho CoA synthase [Paenibacillus sp. IHB B 3084]
MIATSLLCESIGQQAVLALLTEVSASPKPGLVDRFNRGAHKDMDFFTFMSSAVALSGYFERCTQAGGSFHGEDLRILFANLRPLGQEAEQAMFAATGGVNTHKGLIFSLGIICTAAAYCCTTRAAASRLDEQVICETVAQMTKGLCASELASLKKSTGLTVGERLYKEWGMTGIRGEVEAGFPTVREYALPVYRELKSSQRYHVNDICVQTLLQLMVVNEDTNVVGRHDREMLTYVQQYAKQVLEAGGILSERGLAMIHQMNDEFVQKNVSPGGSADLLAVTIMLEYLCLAPPAI